MRLFVSYIISMLIFAGCIYAQGQETQGNKGKENPFVKMKKAEENLETHLAEREKGVKVDLDKIVGAVDFVKYYYFRLCDMPGDEGGLVSWGRYAKKLSANYPKSVKELIHKGFDEADSFIIGLGDIGGDQNVKFLSEYLDKRLERLGKLKEQGLEDVEWRFNIAVVRALGRAKNKKAWPVLRRALNSENHNFCCNAMDELARAGDESIIYKIRDWLSHKDDKKFYAATRAVVNLSTKELRPILAKDLHKPLTKVLMKLKSEQNEVIRALASTGDKSALLQLHESVLDESEYLLNVELRKSFPDPWRGSGALRNDTQYEALKVIAKLGNPESLLILDKLSSEAKDKKVRSKAKEIAEAIRKKKDLKQ